MMYLVALILPPLALLMLGRIFQAILNLIVFALGIVLAIVSFGAIGILWLIAVIWAIIVVYRDRSDARMRRIAEDTLRGPGA